MIKSWSSLAIKLNNKERTARSLSCSPYCCLPEKHFRTLLFKRDYWKGVDYQSEGGKRRKSKIKWRGNKDGYGGSCSKLITDGILKQPLQLTWVSFLQIPLSTGLATTFKCASTEMSLHYSVSNYQRYSLKFPNFNSLLDLFELMSNIWSYSLIIRVMVVLSRTVVESCCWKSLSNSTAVESDDDFRWDCRHCRCSALPTTVIVRAALARTITQQDRIAFLKYNTT